MAAIRTFVAISIAGTLHKTLSEIMDKLSSSKASVKWVEPHNAHLTLKFLGNVDEQRMPEVFAACEKAAEGFAPIEIEVRAVGCFPSVKRPRVIWLGIEEGAEAIKQLQRRVESELERIGFPKEERGFTAHLTIGRVKGQQGLSRLCRILEEERNIFIGSMRVGKLSVMQSRPLSSGPVYTELKAIPLLQN